MRAIRAQACVVGAGLALAGAAAGTPVFDMRATLYGDSLGLAFVLPVGPASPCRTYLQWQLRDQVVREPRPGVRQTIWAIIWESPVRAYDRCASPRRLIGQPYATVRLVAPGRVRFSGIRERPTVRQGPRAVVCVRASRVWPDALSSSTSCVMGVVG
jgi:hypothetical protein